MKSRGDGKGRRRWALITLLLLVLFGGMLWRWYFGRLDVFGACDSGDDRVLVYAANGNESVASKAVIMRVPVSESVAIYDLNDGESDIVLTQYLTGGEARRKLCTSSSWGDGGSVSEAVEGNLVVEFEIIADAYLPSRVRVTATDLLFENGHKIDDLEIDWVRVFGMPS